MNDILSFAQQHSPTVIIWFVLIIAIIMTELWNKKQKAPTIESQKLVEQMNDANTKVIDIRNHQQFRQGHILNSKNIPWLNQDETVFKALQNEPFVLVCQQGQTASQLADKLKKQGFLQVCVLAGGLNAWQQNNLPLVKGK